MQIRASGAEDVWSRTRADGRRETYASIVTSSPLSRSPWRRSSHAAATRRRGPSWSGTGGEQPSARLLLLCSHDAASSLTPAASTLRRTVSPARCVVSARRRTLVGGGWMLILRNEAETRGTRLPRSPAPLEAALSQHADQCRAEAPISPQPDASSSGHFIPSPRAIPAAAQQPAPLTAAQSVVQDRLPGRLITQDVDLLGGAARAKSATRYRFQDREFDQPECVARLHSSSLRADNASPAAACQSPQSAQWRARVLSCRSRFATLSQRPRKAGVKHRAGCECRLPLPLPRCGSGWSLGWSPDRRPFSSKRTRGAVSGAPARPTTRQSTSGS